MAESVSRPIPSDSGFLPTSTRSVLRECEALGHAVSGDVGEIVEKVQKLILHYYDDVREQADRSLQIARRTAIAGFVVLLLTIGYVLFVDWAVRDGRLTNQASTSGMTIGQIGLIGGGIVEFLAATQFVLQGRTTKQFGAFHICLERTHRYLLAYKIAEKMTANKDETLARIVCIMANAPMITRDDIDAVGSTTPLPSEKTSASPSAFAAIS
jgi:hypothetical protein